MAIAIQYRKTYYKKTKTNGSSKRKKYANKSKRSKKS